PAGFPDLVLVHGDRGRILYRELKSTKGRVSPAQTEWINDLISAGQDAGVWRPQDWINRTIEQELRR
ncbi:VRR-NUC domain-containing protein, partial [Staphylococcus aureus]